MNKMLKWGAIAAALCLAGTAGATTVVYSDTFDNVATGLNVPGFNGWSVTDGTVDVIGAGSAWDYLPNGAGSHYVDLDGSTGDAGLLSRTLTGLTAGAQYVLSFDLGGNHAAGGQYGSDTVKVNFGGATATYANIAWDAAWTTYVVTGTADANGELTISYANAGGDNVGALLDNVSVTTAVPEPESAALMLAGIGAMLLVRRRRID